MEPWSRRRFIQIISAGPSTAVMPMSEAAQPVAQAEQLAGTATANPLAPIDLDINGRQHRLNVDMRSTLLDVLREQLGLTGTKKGCDRGECGACTVHVDGHRVLSCLTLAVRVQGHSITTIEGLGQPDRLHPLQAAFIEHDAFQCGYCTSGQIMSGVACIKEGHAGSAAEVAEFMSGNLCRCAAYPQIRAAILDVASKAKGA